jgi:hypothetical protein
MTRATSMLFDPARHEPLVADRWDADRALGAISAIVASAQDAYDPQRFWPLHPLEDSDPASSPPQKNLYFGAAGNAWALWYLNRLGLAKLRLDPAEVIDLAHEAYLAEPDTGEVVPSLFLGEVGILLVRWRLTQSARAAERLASAIKKNRGNPVNEALWGAPGTMQGALHMHRWTHDPLWRELFVADAEELLSGWRASPHADCALWTQDLYGSVVQLIGAGHGFAGNVYPLLRGAAMLSHEAQERIYRDCVQTLRATAIREGGAINWPPHVGPGRPGRDKNLVQWCHGAPGIATAIAGYPRGRSAELDDLLVAAGETTWAAGPLAKGPGLCHGTAGNGYAFLKLHERSGHAVWLERARRFAMHAIGQWKAASAHYGCGRHSLWTGDTGLAVYLAHCIQGDGGLPGLDLLD